MRMIGTLARAVALALAMLAPAVPAHSIRRKSPAVRQWDRSHVQCRAPGARRDGPQEVDQVPGLFSWLA